MSPVKKGPCGSIDIKVVRFTRNYIAEIHIIWYRFSLKNHPHNLDVVYGVWQK